MLNAFLLVFAYVSFDIVSLSLSAAIDEFRWKFYLDILSHMVHDVVLFQKRASQLPPTCIRTTGAKVQQGP